MERKYNTSALIYSALSFYDVTFVLASYDRDVRWMGSLDLMNIMMM